MFRIRRARRRWLGPAILAALVLPVVAPSAAAGKAPAGPASLTATDCGPALKLDRKDFPNSPKVTNKFLPLSPGMQYVLDGAVLDLDAIDAEGWGRAGGLRR